MPLCHARRRRGLSIHVLALIDHLARGGAELLLSQFADRAGDVRRKVRLGAACLKDSRGGTLRPTACAPSAWSP